MTLSEIKMIFSKSKNARNDLLYDKLRDMPKCRIHVRHVYQNPILGSII